MSKINMTWITAKAIHPEHGALPVRQVYVWLFTPDEKFLVVSKDGHKWQFPGGKPDTGETARQTAVREVKEETGVDISQQASQLKFFGYYHVVKIEDDGSSQEFLQLRFTLRLEKPADALSLHVEHEDSSQDTSDQVKFARAVTVEEAKSLIFWLDGSDELKAATQANRP
jgi:8-oxo-dGTP pyrophosphatase MutT (NUDIX family)